MQPQEDIQVESKENLPKEGQKVTENSVESNTSETSEQINWRKFREQRELERKQKEAAEKIAIEKAKETEALKAALEAIVNKPSSRSSEQHEEQYLDEDEDKKIDRKVRALLEEREKQYEQQRAQREQSEIPQRLAQTYSDFSDVCNQENLDYLEFHYPEIARSYSRTPDSFEKWSDVYKAVKRFVPNTNSRKDQAKAEKNFNKPQSMTVPGVTQTGDTTPMMLDDKRRTDNWARMQRVMKGGK